MRQERDWNVFISSVFFVLGFSLVFSLAGVLLQSVLSGTSFASQKWLERIGGGVIVLFGIWLLGLIRPKVLEREYKLTLKRRFKFFWITSFVFGAAFAVGWTPCVGPVLGAVLTLAATRPGSAFTLLSAYSLGLGIPFLLVGLFINEARAIISASGRWLKYLNYVFATILILLGILMFTGQLSRISNLSFVSDFSVSHKLAGFTTSLNLGIAFFAGLVSFLSPCVLPLIPGFLSYLASLPGQKSEIRSQINKAPNYKHRD